jgi:hypothetical protein
VRGMNLLNYPLQHKWHAYKKNTLVQYKTTFNFQIKIKLGNKSWIRSGIHLGSPFYLPKTQKLSKVHKHLNTKGIVVN